MAISWLDNIKCNLDKIGKDLPGRDVGGSRGAWREAWLGVKLKSGGKIPFRVALREAVGMEYEAAV